MSLKVPPVVRGVTVLRRMAVALLALCLLAACGRGKAPQTEEERASLAAKECYEALYLNGHPETFLYGRINASQMPQSFRQQLLTGYKQHLRQVEQQRKGVSSIDVVRAQADTSLQVMQVFLSLGYGNGTKEEIVVPMVKAADGSWHIK